MTILFDLSFVTKKIIEAKIVTASYAHREDIILSLSPAVLLCQDHYRDFQILYGGFPRLRLWHNVAKNMRKILLAHDRFGVSADSWIIYEVKIIFATAATMAIMSVNHDESVSKSKAKEKLDFSRFSRDRKKTGRTEIIRD